MRNIRAGTEEQRHEQEKNKDDRDRECDRWTGT